MPKRPPDDAIAETLATAWEGGSNYWIDRADRRPYTVAENGDVRLRLPVTIWPVEGDQPVVLDRAAIRRGLRLFQNEFPHQFADEFPAGRDEYNGDAESADIFLQLCLLGEVVYG